MVPGDWAGRFGRAQLTVATSTVAGAAPVTAAYRRTTIGTPADLVVTRARTCNELPSRPQADPIVIVAGRQIDTTLPDHRELDHLVGSSQDGLRRHSPSKTGVNARMAPIPIDAFCSAQPENRVTSRIARG
jgi:hypothetical protein